MPKTQFQVVRSIIFAASVCLCSNAFADEGTSDPDFDYLPPDAPTMFDKMTEVFSNFFRKPSHAGSYETAKRRLYASIMDKNSFYCGCRADLANRTFNKAGCGYRPRNNNDRAKRLEAEHILPAFWIAKFHAGKPCWKKDPSCGGARKCCLKNDSRFKKAHNDLVNLAPSIGELNADRSNLTYDLINGEPRRYGSCDFEVNTTNKVTEPKDKIRGDIARVYFYMRDTYSLKYPTDLSARLKAWDLADPVSKEEKARNKRIQDTQGSSNPLLQN